MSYCTPCPPCDTEYPLLCEPLETTANGKRLVVEDSAACQKTIQTPVAQQILKTDGAGNLTWTNGASGTVLRKDSTGLVEFATLNSVLQSGPVDLGSQPLTTTGALTSENLKTTGTGSDNNITFINTSNTVGMQGMRLAFDSDRLKVQKTSDLGVFESDYVSIDQDNGNVGIGTNSPQNFGASPFWKTLQVYGISGGVFRSETSSAILDFYATSDIGGLGVIRTNNYPLAIQTNGVNRIRILSTGQVGVGTESPAKTLHVNGTVRLQGLPTYANNAAAIAGGLAAGDLFIANVSGEGQLRIVI
jgi:hypothetical protein